jgi:hypothetical protein
MKTGLEVTDYVGTPVIVKTPWQRGRLNTKPILHGDFPF